ncbi:MAG TPA: VIT domain-containing protein, partial [Polyangiaceae bacterium]|nr:VIT domain-containing protein [Polyangiaceae bacterium]
MMPMPTIDDEPRAVSGGRLVTPDGRTLPLEGTSLETTACGGIARTVLRQRFRNVFAEPLQVVYQVPLPADGAVSGYAFVIGDRRIVGEVDKKEAARERYEQALVEGRSAALLEQDRSSLFTQELGNIPAGASVTAELTIDQKLRWLSEGRWEWRFPTVAAPRYMGGRVPDAERVAIDVADREMSPRAALSLRIADHEARPDSPTHGLRVERAGRDTLVGFKDEGARLDRDIAVSWPAGGDRPSVALAVARRRSAHGLLTLVPPRELEPSDEVARDLIVLIDTSGSMHGEPLAQAKRVCMALVDSSSDRDSLALIEFSMQARSWRSEPVRATAEAKADARRWLSVLEAGGGTEMMTGILAALEPLRSDAQRQVVIVSDGLIGFEHEVVGAIMNKLPRSSRVHTVGVGSAVNRSLTAAAARAGRGYEAIVGIGEDPERIAERLVMRTRAPVIVDVAIEGTALMRHAPARIGDLFANAPTLCALELAPAGGELVVRGRSAHGSWQERVAVPPIDEDHGDPAVVALFAR